MLTDKDRIFTNIYGMHDRSLAGARARGHWDGTAAIIKKGRDWVVDTMKASGLRGRGGAGFRRGLNGPSCPRKAMGVRLISLLTQMNQSRERAKTVKSCAMIRIH